MARAEISWRECRNFLASTGGSRELLQGQLWWMQEDGRAAPSQGARLARRSSLKKTVASALKMEWEAAEARKTEGLKMEDGGL